MIADKIFHNNYGRIKYYKFIREVFNRDTMRAGIALLKNNMRITQGGSTITQQVIKNNLLTQEKSYTGYKYKPSGMDDMIRLAKETLDACSGYNEYVSLKALYDEYSKSGENGKMSLEEVLELYDRREEKDTKA